MYQKYIKKNIIIEIVVDEVKNMKLESLKLLKKNKIKIYKL